MPRGGLWADLALAARVAFSALRTLGVSRTKNPVLSNTFVRFPEPALLLVKQLGLPAKRA